MTERWLQELVEAAEREVRSRGVDVRTGSRQETIFGIREATVEYIEALDGGANVLIFLEDETLAFVELRTGDLTATGQIGSGYLREESAVGWLADLVSGRWQARRRLLILRLEVRTLTRGPRLIVMT